MDTVQKRRRRSGRVRRKNPTLLEAIGQEGHGAFGITEDIGRGGCSVIAPTLLQPGAALKLYLSVRSEVLEAEGRIVHHRSMPDGRYEMGIEILKMDPVQRSRFNLHFGGLSGDSPQEDPDASLPPGDGTC